MMQKLRKRLPEEPEQKTLLSTENVDWIHQPSPAGPAQFSVLPSVYKENQDLRRTQVQ